MTNRPNLRHLRAFAVAAEHQNISKAAEICHLSQSAVSQAIHGLEQFYDCALLERRNNGVYPTAYGRIAADRIDRAFDRLAGAVDRAGGARRQLAGTERLISATQLAALGAVAAAGGFKAGAQRLGLTQPSVHRAVRDLEALLGVELVERTSLGFTPSRHGAAFALDATLVLKEIDHIADDIDLARGRFEGRVAVGSLALGQSDILPRAINALTGRFPNARFFLQDGSFEQLYRALRHGEIDLIIGARRLTEEPGLAQEVLFTDHLSVMARPGHPLQQAESLSVDRLMDWPWVVPRPGTPTRACCEALFAHCPEKPPRGLIETGSMVMVRGLIAGSDRLTVLSRRQVAVEEKAGLLAPLDFTLPEMERDIALMTRQNWLPTELQTALVAELRSLTPV
jgi:DNA-binding transcriptional LysR family regulator